NSTQEVITANREPQSANHTQQLVEPMAKASEDLTPGEPRTLRLSLKPIELGRVEVEIVRDKAGHLSAHLAVEHEETRRILSNGLSHLREALEHAGLQVDRLDVSIDFGMNHNAERDAYHSGADRFAGASGHELFEPEPAISSGTQAAEDRLLNLHA